MKGTLLTTVRLSMFGLLLTLSTGALAADACLLTPDELKALTGRAFEPGQPGKNLADDSPLCHYAESENPQRKLTIGMSTTNAKQQFDSRVRMLSMGGKSIELTGVGDGAYYNGTSAGALSLDKLVTFSNLRRSTDPQIAADSVAQALNAALKKTK